MFNKISDFPKRIWDGLKNLSPMSIFQREIGNDPAPTGEDFSAVCTEIIAIENGVIDLHTYVTKVDDKVDEVKKEIDDKIAAVEKMPGPPGKDGESIQGDPGPPGKDGESIQGDPGPPGKDGLDAKPLTIEWIKDRLKIGDVLSPPLTGPRGKNAIPQKRLAGLGGGLSGGLEGKKGDPGEKGEPGSGAVVLEAEASCDIAIGQPIRILNNTQAALGQDGSCLGLALTSALTGFAVTWCGDGGLVSNPDWSLTPGATYFLGDTPGTLSTVPGTNYVYKIGYAINTTDFLIELAQPIKL